VGGDNIQDCWFPGGNLDPLALMAASLFKAHLAPWERLGLEPFSSEAARLMGLIWDGVLRPGAPADLMLLEVSSWSEALSEPPRRRVLINGEWLDLFPDLAELQH
jgi:cytosine deaminase